MRKASIKRTTAETDISLDLLIDGTGKRGIATGCGFLDHMLTLFAVHGQFDMELRCKGDVEVDYHHTTEDIGICLGGAFREAAGDFGGIKRYSSIILPMDEALVMCAVDISGRGTLRWNVDIPAEKVGDFDTELAHEFWTAFCRVSGFTMHFRMMDGENSHHIIEAVFKAASRAVSDALSLDARLGGRVPSSKGTI